MTRIFSDDLCIEVSGDYACFTMPEHKVERVSYQVPTPSAVRSIFEAFLWKPEIKWHVTKIEVINPIKTCNMMFNEITQKPPFKNGIDVVETRTQRNSIILKDVKYRFYAKIELLTKDHHIRKYVEQFMRYVLKGKPYRGYNPYLGMSNFPVKEYSLITRNSKNIQPPIDISCGLGRMFYDFKYKKSIPGKPETYGIVEYSRWYSPVMKNGVIEVPSEDSQNIKDSSRE